MDNKEVEHHLLNIPLTVADAQIALLEKKKQLNELQAFSEQEALKEIISINNAVDEKGKKLYSNEQARNAILTERLAENVGYKNLAEKANVLKEEIAKTEIQIQCNINLFLAYKAIAGMSCELWSAEI